jgi:hypothetical protein
MSQPLQRRKLHDRGLVIAHFWSQESVPSYTVGVTTFKWATFAVMRYYSKPKFEIPRAWLLYSTVLLQL